MKFTDTRVKKRTESFQLLDPSENHEYKARTVQLVNEMGAFPS